MKNAGGVVVLTNRCIRLDVLSALGTILMAMHIFSLQAQELVQEERVSTFKPFVRGDIFVAATIMDHPTDDHMGTGRILQYDNDLQEKGVLYTIGTKHKVGGLAFAPDGTLWAFAQGTPSVVEIDRSGLQKPVRFFSERTLSSVTFASDGSSYFGEHLQGKKSKISSNTTVFNMLAGRDVIGDGNIFKFGQDANLITEYETETHGGVAGIHGVTSTVLLDEDTRIVYISETGNRVMQYDVTKRKQLPDLKVFNEDENVFMVLTLVSMIDGSLLISTGNGLVIIDEDTGDVVRYYDLESSGWAASAPTIDGRGIVVGNFFTGQIVILNTASGEVVKSNYIGQRNSLSGVSQFAG